MYRQIVSPPWCVQGRLLREESGTFYMNSQQRQKQFNFGEKKKHTHTQSSTLEKSTCNFNEGEIYVDIKNRQALSRGKDGMQQARNNVKESNTIVEILWMQESEGSDKCDGVTFAQKYLNSGA